VLLAAFAGVYVTPLNAVLQAVSPAEARARYIACSNVIDASFMVGSAGLTGVMIAAGVAVDMVLVLTTLSALPMAFLVARHAPDTRLGRVALSIWPRADGLP